MMADNELNNVGGDDIFVYTGGDQEVPRDVKWVRIAENIDTIPARAFYLCYQLIEVEGHNKIKKIERSAFGRCRSLRRVTNMTGLTEIEEYAFYRCIDLSELEFDKLEIIGNQSFALCKSLRSINMPSIRRVGGATFQTCHVLTDVVFGKDLERIEVCVFFDCASLRSIVIPLKYGLFVSDDAFSRCQNLSRVDILDGWIHNTISSLHLESWRDEMQEEMDRINQTLPNTHSAEKAGAIQEWITRVLSRMEHYKSEHKMLVKEAMTLLELALWKAKILNETDEKKCNMSKKAKIDAKAARKEHRVTCGASIVIKNVLHFLELK
jgi:hypothetical protein